jgi:Flp pilus assembly protein CpaB
LKRSSNRLVLLVGLFLAVVAFVLIAVLFSGGGTGSGSKSTQAPTVDVVVAAKDLPLGSTITADAVETKAIDATSKPADSYAETSLVIGQVARQPLTKGELITSEILNGGGAIGNIHVPAGYVGIAVQVDQVTGVGTLIKPGDRVDVVTGFTGQDKVPLVVKGAGAGAVQPSGSPRPGQQQPGSDADYHTLNLPYNSTTIKTVVDGLQVLGTLLPPPTTTQQPAPSGQPQGATTLNGQQEIVILAATSQQAEAIRFAQVDGTIALVLRSADDCKNADGTAGQCPIIPTSGITLRRLVDDFGVLPPQVIEVLEPSPYPNPQPSRAFPSPTPSPSPNPSGSLAPSLTPSPTPTPSAS